MECSLNASIIESTDSSKISSTHDTVAEKTNKNSSHKLFGNIIVLIGHLQLKIGTSKNTDQKDWLISMSGEFLKSIKKADKKLKGRILDAISVLSKEPNKSQGNTVKPLTSEFKGLWRYRMGDYRLIYQPDGKNRTVKLLLFSPRSSAYA